MKRILLTLALCLGVLATASHAQAQLSKIFVASTGNDANDGSRGSPKRNFQAAHNAVAAGGQIVVLDTAGYGQLSITKSLAITVPPGVNGFVSITGNTTAIFINAGATDSVSLRGLILEGTGSRTSGSTGGYGIYAYTVGTLTVDDCTIRNFYDGLFFKPSGYIDADGNLAVHRTTVLNCRYGIDAETGNQYTFTKTYVSDCQLINNGDALYAGTTISGQNEVIVSVDGTSITNSSIGVHIHTAQVYISNCKLNFLASAITTDGTPDSNNRSISFGNNSGYNASAGYYQTIPLK